jgi:hypothetical protein
MSYVMLAIKIVIVYNKQEVRNRIGHSSVAVGNRHERGLPVLLFLKSIELRNSGCNLFLPRSTAVVNGTICGSTNHILHR